MIYVDALRVHPGAPHPFHRGSCHMTADTLEELHAFAARIGMRRRWFQNHPRLPHYDLTPRRRAQALKLGAVEQTTRELLRPRLAGEHVTGLALDEHLEQFEFNEIPET